MFVQLFFIVVGWLDGVLEEIDHLLQIDPSFKTANAWGYESQSLTESILIKLTFQLHMVAITITHLVS